MGLLIGAGNLADAVEEDEAEDLAWCRHNFAEVNRVLAAHGLPEHREPERLPPMPVDISWSLEGMPYTWFSLLQRAVAHARQRARRLKPLGDDGNPNPAGFVQQPAAQLPTPKKLPQPVAKSEPTPIVPQAVAQLLPSGKVPQPAAQLKEVNRNIEPLTARVANNVRLPCFPFGTGWPASCGTRCRR